MILLKVNKDYKEQIKLVTDSSYTELELYPEEYLECEYNGGDNAIIKNGRLSECVTVDFINKFMSVVEMDDNILNSPFKVNGKTVKRYIQKYPKINYVVQGEKYRTMCINVEALYTITATYSGGLTLIEDVSNKKTPEVEPTKFEDKINNPDLKKAVGWMNGKIENIRTPQENSSDLGIDIFFNTFVDVMKEFVAVGEQKSKELMEKMPSKEEIQKKSSEYIQKANEKVNEVAKNIKDKKEVFEQTIQKVQEDSVPLTLEELKTMAGMPVWYETPNKKGWGIVKVSIDEEVSVVGVDTDINITTYLEEIVVYKNKPIQKEVEVKDTTIEEKTTIDIDVEAEKKESDLNEFGEKIIPIEDEEPIDDLFKDFKAEDEELPNLNFEKETDEVKESVTLDKEETNEENKPIDLKVISDLAEKMNVSMEMAKEAIEYGKDDIDLSIAYIKAKTCPYATPSITFEQRVKLFYDKY